MTTSVSTIEAAGAVVVREIDGRPHVLVVHRPHRSDWSLPKGKLETGEAHDVAAVREVFEETGVRCVLGPFLGSREYVVDDAPKRVLYWRATVVTQDPREADAEVDDVAWIPAAEVNSTLTYQDDRDLVTVALSFPDTQALIVLRHAEATKRVAWQESGSPDSQDDNARPLNPAGLVQAQTLTHVLACYGPTRVISSSAHRCEATVAPFAAAFDITVQLEPALSELGFRDNPEATFACVTELLSSSQPAIWCTHRPVLPAVTRALGRELTVPAGADPLDLDPRLKPTAALILHLDKDRTVVATEHRHAVPTSE
jgi:8-oxo-dGTP diphosphatase